MDRLDYAEEFMRAIVAHGIDGGSFRYLIYDRLGFGPEAYTPLYLAGGMTFSNACPLNLEPEVAPHFSHAGVGTVESIDGKHVKVSIGDNLKVAIGLPGHVFVIGGPALVVYFANASGGQHYAASPGVDISAWNFAEKRLGRNDT